MAKRSLSPAPLPPAKRSHLSTPPAPTPHAHLHIFTCLSYTDLCVAQSINRNWARLSLDNQLWKNLYLREFGRLRLRGSRGFGGRRDGRETKISPAQDWKRMFRISTNWRSGRCHASTLDDMSTFPRSICQSPTRQVGTSGQEQGHKVPRITLAGKYTVIFSPELSHPRPSSFFPPPAQSTADHSVAYCHPVLVTLSESFTLSVYDVTHEAIQVVHVLTSFTSFPPSSLVLTMPESQTYKLVLTYASPRGVTEVILSNATLHSPTSPFTSPTRPPSLLLSTRSTRAFDIPAGWIDEAKLRVVREQWGRKVGSVAGTQTDGRWVVLAPAVQGEARPPGGFTPASLPLQLYRLSSPPLRAGAGAAPKLTFVRSLLGQTGPVSALALADGRCVSLGVDGKVWVWDLENGWGTEVGFSAGSSESGESALRGTIAFDERRIITAGAAGDVMVRDFDV
ncbi:hypothetical protein BJV77DRAFT_1058113 [Russula vinacea]|nr:hypothetical protein BJV77DRAFT_1058113 [Russula vinacea]